MAELQMLVWTEQLTMNQALMTTLIGLVVVFVVLAILIGFIELMHFLLKEKTTNTVEKAHTEKPEERISAGVMAEAPEISDVASDGEFIAAVSAAISVYTGKPNGSFKIKSIKKG